MPLEMKCICGKGSRWLEQSPESNQRYRVECARCRKFVKWGNGSQLRQLIDAGEDGELVTYQEQLELERAKPNLEKFITDD